MGLGTGLRGLESRARCCNIDTMAHYNHHGMLSPDAGTLMPVTNITNRIPPQSLQLGVLKHHCAEVVAGGFDRESAAAGPDCPWTHWRIEVPAARVTVRRSKRFEGEHRWL